MILNTMKSAEAKFSYAKPYQSEFEIYLSEWQMKTVCLLRRLEIVFLCDENIYQMSFTEMCHRIELSVIS